MPRPARRATSTPVVTGRRGVVIPGLYVKVTAALTARAQAVVTQGDPRAILLDHPDEAELARHDPRGVIVGPALKELAKLRRGNPVIVPRSMVTAEIPDTFPMFDRDIRGFVVTPDDRVSPDITASASLPVIE